MSQQIKRGVVRVFFRPFLVYIHRWVRTKSPLHGIAGHAVYLILANAAESRLLLDEPVDHVFILQELCEIRFIPKLPSHVTCSPKALITADECFLYGIPKHQDH